MSFLVVREVTKAFGGLMALNRLSFEVERGEIVGLVGPNGAGKTTCFNVITGFLPLTSGQVFFKQKEITGLPPHRILAQGIARTFQITSVFSQSTVLQNVLIGLHRKLERGLFLYMADNFLRTKRFREGEKWAVRKAIETLELLGLKHHRDELARNLSLPDQRKLEICIAVATDPELLLFDEPAAGMPIHDIASLINQLKILSDKGMTIVVVDHNMKFLMNLCQRIVTLHHGAKVAEGTPVEIVANPMVREIYLAKENSYARDR